jgi:hypothetical protein
MVQDLLITADVLKESFEGWEADVKLINALCKECMRKYVDSGMECTFPPFQACLFSYETS